MSEKEDKAVVFEGKNTSDQIPQGTGNQEQIEQQTPQYLTRDEVQTLLEAQKDDLLRQTQSLTDKASSRMDKKLRDELNKINEVIALQEAAGVTHTEEEKMKIRQRAYDEVLKKFGEEPDDSASQVQSEKKDVAGPNKDASFVDELVNEIYKTSGVTIFESDPEASMLDNSSPLAFIDSIRQAVEKKKQRTETAPETRITSLGKGTSAYQDEEAIAAELSKLQKNPSANKERRKELVKQLEELQKK